MDWYRVLEAKKHIDSMTNEELNELIPIMQARRSQLGLEVRRTLNVGDDVKFSSHIRPRMLAGRFGKIVSITGDKAVVDLPVPMGKWYKGIRTPFGLLEALPHKEQ